MPNTPTIFSPSLSYSILKNQMHTHNKKDQQQKKGLKSYKVNMQNIKFHCYWKSNLISTSILFLHVVFMLFGKIVKIYCFEVWTFYLCIGLTRRGPGSRSRTTVFPLYNLITQLVMKVLIKDRKTYRCGSFITKEVRDVVALRNNRHDIDLKMKSIILKLIKLVYRDDKIMQWVSKLLLDPQLHICIWKNLRKNDFRKPPSA